MNRKHITLTAALVLAAAGFWFARSFWRTPEVPAADIRGVGEAPSGPAHPDPAHPGPPRPGQHLRPPDPTRRFTDFTPEQRVEFARKGSGPGG